jgi:hypothetical protein
VTKIYYDIDGGPVAANECMWVKLAPCGCECGWSRAEYCPDEAQAWDDFWDSKSMRRRDEKRGFRVAIKRRSDIRISETCPHTPRWGIEPRPELDGHTWATMHRTKVLHLVPLVIAKGSYSPHSQMLVPSLCGRTDARIWSASDYDTRGLVECASCLKAARERLAGAA